MIQNIQFIRSIGHFFILLCFLAFLATFLRRRQTKEVETWLAGLQMSVGARVERADTGATGQVTWWTTGTQGCTRGADSTGVMMGETQGAGQWTTWGADSTGWWQTTVGQGTGGQGCTKWRVGTSNTWCTQGSSAMKSFFLVTRREEMRMLWAREVRASRRRTFFMGIKYYRGIWVSWVISLSLFAFLLVLLGGLQESLLLLGHYIFVKGAEGVAIEGEELHLVLLLIGDTLDQGEAVGVLVGQVAVGDLFRLGLDELTFSCTVHQFHCDFSQVGQLLLALFATLQLLLVLLEVGGEGLVFSEEFLALGLKRVEVVLAGLVLVLLLLLGLFLLFLLAGALLAFRVDSFVFLLVLLLGLDLFQLLLHPGQVGLLQQGHLCRMLPFLLAQQLEHVLGGVVEHGVDEGGRETVDGEDPVLLVAEEHEDEHVLYIQERRCIIQAEGRSARWVYCISRKVSFQSSI